MRCNRELDQAKRQFLKHSACGLGSIALSYSLPVCADQQPGVTKLATHQAIATLAKSVAIPGAQLKLLLPNGSQANLIPIVEQFKQLTGIEVTFDTTAVDEINTQILVRHARKQTDFDIALPASFGIPDLAAADAILDLTTYRDKYEPSHLSADALYQHADSFKGRFYGYQTDGDCYLMFYNTQFYADESKQKRYEDKYGRKIGVPKTWQELDRQMQFFNSPHELQYGGALFRTPDYVLWEWWLRTHAKNNLPLDPSGKPNIDTDEAVLALEEMVTATQSQYPNAMVNGLFENWKAFSQGNIYANIGWGGSQKYFNQQDSKIKNHLDFSLPPGDEATGRESVAYFNWGWNFTVAKNCKQPDLAYLFCAFAVCPEPSTIAVSQSGGFFDPYRSEHYDNEQIIDVYTKAFLDVHKTAMKNCIPDFYISGRNAYLNTLKKYIMLAIQQELAPQKALTLAKKNWTKLHIRHGLQNQKKQWDQILKKYRKVNFI